MQFEVEQKFEVAIDDELSSVVRAVIAAGGKVQSTEQHIDEYFAHPARDFAQTDEALRIRRRGEENLVTYKGPKIDAATKTRKELELPLPPGDAGAEAFGELLAALGFRPVAKVRKQRRPYSLTWQGWPVEVAFDLVDEVGSYVELEIVADEAQLPAAKAALAELASRLGLERVERRSYLELLLAGRE